MTSRNAPPPLSAISKHPFCGCEDSAAAVLAAELWHAPRRLPDFGVELVAVGRSGLHTHHGLYMGDGTVIHLAGATGTAKSAGEVQRVTFCEFAGGRTVTAVRPDG